MTPRAADERLHDILSAIAAIRRIEAESVPVDIAAAATQYHLLVIGEAVRTIDPEQRARVAFPWDAVVGMRNHLAHEYFRLDSLTLAQALEQPLDDLDAACRSLLESS